jgi:glucosamine--fructose-6-phosphate aminotransferase (isomerizing)
MTTGTPSPSPSWPSPSSAVRTGRPARGSLLAAEIAEQPQSLERLLDDGVGAIRDVADQVRRAGPRFVLLAARGTSDHAALYAKYLLEIRLGLPCGLVSPSTLTAYGSRPDLSGVWWIAVSQSGRSPDLVESTAVAGERGALTVAVTNDPASPLAAAAHRHLDVLAGPERAVAATKSYTSQLLALHLLVDAVAGGDGSAAARVPELAARTLERGDAGEQAARYRFVERLVTTGRGYAYPTAREAALKLMETSYLSAHAFSAADLLHGPLAMIDEDRPVIAVVPDGVGGRAVEPVLDRLHERGADVLVVGDERVLAAWGGSRSTAQIPLPAGIEESVAPIVQILPLQQLAHAMAVARGYDPDAPRGLSKQTLTW